MEHEKKLRISAAAMAEVEAALRDYAREVLQAGLSEMATNLRCDNAGYFVSWLKHEYTPGQRLKP
jgi:hypothetical protein